MSNEWTVIDPASVIPSPWKKGGELTRELLAWPASRDWHVRVSVADVERDGPFSTFTGVQRWFAVLEGEGVHLHIRSCEHLLDVKSHPLEFDGAEAVDCRLTGGPTRDFNLMVRGGGGVLRRLRSGVVREVSPGTWLGLYAVKGVARVCGVQVPVGQFAWSHVKAAERIDASAPEMLWMEVS